VQAVAVGSGQIDPERWISIWRLWMHAGAWPAASSVGRRRVAVVRHGIELGGSVSCAKGTTA
jgi:hypothetical protein